MGLLSWVCCVCLVLIGWADWRWRKIWHVTTVPMGVGGVVFASRLPSGSPANGLAGGGLALLLFLAIWWLSNRQYGVGAFGFGDVMLAAVLGTVGGVYWGGWMLAIGMVLAGAGAASVLILDQRNRFDRIPYGSFLCLGGVIGLFAAGLSG